MAGGGGSENTSRSIEVMYGFATGSKQESGFKAEVDAWAQENDVDIEYAQTGSFDQLINTRVQGGDPPDVGLFPQPGIMRDLAAEGELADLSDVVPQESLDAQVQGALATGQVDDAVRGAGEHQRQEHRLLPEGGVRGGVRGARDPRRPGRAHRPDPGDRHQPVVLRHRVRGGDRLAGHRLGREPDADQLRRDVYNQWVNHEIPFNDPQVADVLDQKEQLLLDEGRTNGGRESIASANFLTAGNPLFDDPPGCFMYRQGNFVADEGGFPEDILANLDEEVGVFPMPGLTAEDKPVLGGGDLAGIFSQDNEAAQELVAFLASPEFGTNGYAETDAWISPNTEFDTSLYPTETLRTIAEIAYESTEFAFDGSDQMPGEVGAGSFWREMTAWISGGTDAATALDNIEASWPA